MKGKKIVPAIAAGFITVILVWAVEQFLKVVIPTNVAIAITGVVTIGISLATPDDKEADE